jgi:hypothetical protein
MLVGSRSGLRQSSRAASIVLLGGILLMAAGLGVLIPLVRDGPRLATPTAAMTHPPDPTPAVLVTPTTETHALVALSSPTRSVAPSPTRAPTAPPATPQATPDAVEPVAAADRDARLELAIAITPTPTTEPEPQPPTLTPTAAPTPPPAPPARSVAPPPPARPKPAIVAVPSTPTKVPFSPPAR